MLDNLKLSKYEEQIYNIHLKVTRTHKNQPFKYRKDFSNLDDRTKLYLKKIALFLQKYNHIKLEDFIAAPYKVYSDEDYFGLDYYTTLKATKAYTLFQNSKLYEDPDSDEQLNYILESLKFIQKFCRNNKLKLTDYLAHMSDKIPSFVLHLKEHEVNLYTLHGFKMFSKYFRQVDPELLRFIIGEETYNRFEISKTKLFSSKKAYLLITSGLQKIKKKLQECS